ncbi:MAG TPA: PD-(D/E)XK nuclease family protein, partial [Myxococcota bacterium]|nr:PD-(D/E)XK nuclease family protein [Myxococcota bacterium]
AAIPPEAVPLLDLGWGRNRDADALLALVERIEHEPNGTRLGFDRVFAVGFGDPTSGLPVPPGTRRLFDRILAGLEATRLAGDASALPDPGPDTTLVSDVATEAAWVAHHAHRFQQERGDLDDVLVLFAGDDDRDRIRATLVRNGIPCAVNQAQRLSRHGLAGLLQEIIPWFTDAPSDAVTIEGETLRRLFQSPLVGAGDYKADEAAALRERIERIRNEDARAREDKDAPEEPQETDDLYLSRRTVPEALVACHRVRASLDEWRASLESVAADASRSFRTRRAALLIGHRMGWLGDLRGPSLGHVREFLNRLTLHTFGDRVAQSIQSALADSKKRPATSDVLAEVLDNAVSSGDLHRGVTLLAYDQYDCRPSALCLLTGMHSKGVGQAPVPDPFFTDDIAARWGRIGGAAHVGFLMDQATAAVARAGTAHACVIQRSADGRAVVPISHRLLHLEGDTPAETFRNYGLALQTPEAANRDALFAEPARVPKDAPAPCGEPASDHAARMATAEWLRAGGAFERAQPADKDLEPITLRDIVSRDWDALPAWLRPYLGDTTAIATAALPVDAVLSVSSGFQPLSHCLFQAFLKTRLKLKEPETLEEELSAKEVGSAVHEALEHIGIDPRWRPTEADLDAAIATLTAELKTEVDERLTAELAKLPQATAALETARRGLADRWKRQVEMYVDARVVAIESLDRATREKTWKKLVKADEFRGLKQGADDFFQTDAHKKHAISWIQIAVEALLRGADPFDESTLAHCNKNSIVTVRAWIHELQVQDLVLALARKFNDMLQGELAAAGPIVGGEPEWHFGVFADRPASAPLSLHLGATRDVQVRGSVDRVRVTEGPDGARAVELLDYKTGTSFVRKLSDELPAGTVPQLLLYALAMKAALADGRGPDGVSDTPHAVRLGYDFLRDASDKGLFTWTPGDVYPSLEEAADLLGWLVALARSGQYPVLPHNLTCPVLQYRGHDYCRFQAVCRFGKHPGTNQPTDDDTQNSEVGE